MRTFLLYTAMAVLTISSPLATEIAEGKIISEARLLGLPENFYELYISPLKERKRITAAMTISSHKGTYREMGRSQARRLLSLNPDYKKDLLKRLKSLVPEGDDVFNKDISAVRKKVRALFPGYLEEIKGFAETMGIDMDMAVRLYSFQYPGRYGGCTIFAVSGKKTATGTILIGRNYDWAPTMNDMRIVHSSPAGSFRSVGWSEFILGRLDGINEHGLVIAMAGSMSRKSNTDGFLHPFIVRRVLDKASNVDEALKIIRSIPASTACNLLVADKRGRAAAVEIIPGKEITLRWLKDDPDGLLVVTNHFQNRGSARMNSFAMPNSHERARIVRRIVKEKNGISADEIKQILNTKRPAGVAMDNYGQLMGTIYSAVFSPGKTSMAGSIGETNVAVSPVKGVGDRAFTVNYVRGDVNINDYISNEGSRPDELDSFSFRGGMFTYYTKNVLNPGVICDVAFKKGLGSDKTYGHHIKLSLSAMGSFSISKLGLNVEYNPVPFFTLSLKGFYLFYYKNIIPAGGPYVSRFDSIRRKINTISESYSTPGVTVSAVFRIAHFITFENRVTFYDMKNRSYEYDSNMLLRKGPVWSSTLEILIPYSRRFLWGVSATANVEFLMKKYRWDPPMKDRYNVKAGPLLIFPGVATNLDLYISTGCWAKLSASMDTGHWSERIYFLAALRGHY